METYAYRRHNTVTQFITTRPIMELFLSEERRPGTRVSMRWWDQEGLDVEGMRTAYYESEQTEGEDETGGTATNTDK